MYPGQQQQTPQQQPSPSLVGQGTQDTGSSAGGPQREGQIRRGVCKFFNSQKGFGFVLDSKAEELGGQEGKLPTIDPSAFDLDRSLNPFYSLCALHCYSEQNRLSISCRGARMHQLNW